MAEGIKRTLANRSDIRKRNSRVASVSVTAGEKKGDEYGAALVKNDTLQPSISMVIEDNLFSGVHAMKRCLHLKLRAKNLLRDIDTEHALKETEGKDGKHTGWVKNEILWEILDMLKVKVREHDKTALSMKFGTEGRIRYKEALAVMTVNTLSMKPMEEPWVVRIGNGFDDQKTSISIKDFLESRVDATSSYQSTRFSSRVSTRPSQIGKTRKATEDRRSVKDPFLNTPVEVIKEETNEASRLSLIDSPTACKEIRPNYFRCDPETTKDQCRPSTLLGCSLVQVCSYQHTGGQQGWHRHPRGQAHKLEESAEYSIDREDQEVVP